MTIGSLPRVAGGLVRSVLRLAIASAVAAGVIATLVLWRWPPEAGEERALAAVALVALAGPPAVLFAFALGLRSLLALPGRLAGLPAEARLRAAELATHAQSARRGGVRTALALWRLRAAALGARGALSLALPLRTLTPAWLGLAALAALAAVLEVGLALVLLLVAATA